MQFLFNIRPPPSPQTYATVFFFKSQHISDDLYVIVWIVLEAPDYTKNIHNPFPLASGRFPWDQNLESRWRFLFEIPQICLLQTVTKTSASQRARRLFFFSCLRKTSPETTSFSSVGEKKGKFPHFKIHDDASVLVTKKSVCHIFLCKALALAEEQHLRLQKCWWRIGWKWLWLSDQSSRRITQSKGCADVHLQQEYTKHWGYLHLMTTRLLCSTAGRLVRPEETTDVLQPDAATLEKKKPIIEAWKGATWLTGVTIVCHWKYFLTIVLTKCESDEDHFVEWLGMSWTQDVLLSEKEEHSLFAELGMMYQWPLWMWLPLFWSVLKHRNPPSTGLFFNGTPWKINMEPTNHPFKENYHPNLHEDMFQLLIFRGVWDIVGFIVLSKIPRNQGVGIP